MPPPAIQEPRDLCFGSLTVCALSFMVQYRAPDVPSVIRNHPEEGVGHDRVSPDHTIAQGQGLA